MYHVRFPFRCVYTFLVELPIEHGDEDFGQVEPFGGDGYVNQRPDGSILELVDQLGPLCGWRITQQYPVGTPASLNMATRFWACLTDTA